MSQELPRKELQLRSLRLEWADITKIFERLQKLVSEQAEREIAALIAAHPEDKEKQDFQDRLLLARSQAFRITVTITGEDQTSVFGDRLELFGSPDVPDRVRDI